MKPILKFKSDSQKGRQREINKDRVEVIERDDYILFIVFDGISSAKNATLAIDKIIEFLRKNEDRILKENSLSLDRLMYEANEYLLSLSLEEGVTTYALVFIQKSKPSEIKFSNLGDTRIYEVTNQALVQLTPDHKLINSSNVVTKYLGMIDCTQSDFFESTKKLEYGGRFLICSDGFYEILEEDPSKLHRILNFKRLGDVSHQLRREIFSKNKDDASYILIDTHV